MYSKEDLITIQSLLDVITHSIDTGEVKDGVVAYDKLMQKYQPNEDPTLLYNYSSQSINLGQAIGNTKMIKKGIKLAKKLIALDNIKEQILKAVYYNLGTAFDTLHQIERMRVGKKYNPFLNNLNLEESKKWFLKLIELEAELSPNDYTNVADNFDALGRFAEALPYYNSAISLDEGHGMSKGNLGISLQKIASIAGRHTIPLYIHAHKLLQEAVGLEENIKQIGGQRALDIFKQHISEIEAIFQDNPSVLKEKLKHSKLNLKSESDFLTYFIRESITNDSFLNLHVFEKDTDAYIHDPLFISLITSTDDNKSFYRLGNKINEIKRAFATGRYLFYKSQFSSDEIKKVNNLTSYIDSNDNYMWNLYTSLLQSSYKELYSVFDKIALFLRDYLDLEIDEESLDYKTMWNNGKGKIKEEIIQTENYILYGLYSISLDLRNSPYGDIRNDMTHRIIYVKEGLQKYDKTSHTIGSENLREMSLKLMRLAKSAITSLIIFVETNERKNNQGKRLAQIVVPETKIE